MGQVDKGSQSDDETRKGEPGNGDLGKREIRKPRIRAPVSCTAWSHVGISAVTLGQHLKISEPRHADIFFLCDQL